MKCVTKCHATHVLLWAPLADSFSICISKKCWQHQCFSKKVQSSPEWASSRINKRRRPLVWDKCKHASLYSMSWYPAAHIVLNVKDSRLYYGWVLVDNSCFKKMTMMNTKINCFENNTSLHFWKYFDRNIFCKLLSDFS